VDTELSVLEGHMFRNAKNEAGWLAKMLLPGIMLTALWVPGATADDSQAPVIHVTLGDYRFSPAEITVSAGKPVVLELQNVDGITPHNFTLKDDAAGLDVAVSVPAGSTKQVTLTPSVAGAYTFYCNKKLPFMKSHRDRGMQGTLVVAPE
jgi:plastocyanin